MTQLSKVPFTILRLDLITKSEEKLYQDSETITETNQTPPLPSEWTITPFSDYVSFCWRWQAGIVLKKHSWQHTQRKGKVWWVKHETELSFKHTLEFRKSQIAWFNNQAQSEVRLPGIKFWECHLWAIRYWAIYLSLCFHIPHL